jgi:hypothetical protein
VFSRHGPILLWSVVVVRAGRKQQLPFGSTLCYREFMARSISVNTKGRGRPKTTGTGALVGVRLQSEMLARLDAFIAAQPQSLTRPEAIRAFVAGGLDQPETASFPSQVRREPKAR